MHITDTQLTLGSKHALQETSMRSTTLERLRADGTDQPQVFGGLFAQELQRLAAGRMADNAALDAIPCCPAPERLHDMLETMLAMLFGKDAGAATPVPQAADSGGGAILALEPGWAAEARPRARWQITQTEQVSEIESCSFSASGKVCLADGSERQFDVGFELARSEETSRTVSRTLIDPLVLDSAAPGTALADARVEFDLNSDGTLEQMRLPGAGSAFLFLDRNHNGMADNGSELFGPETGNGFNELARLDSDHNGWIDGADPAFADLMLWQAADEGQSSVRRLDEAGVGALATAAAATPFALKEHGEQVGQIRSSSVWLGETSGAGVVRQIDVATTPVAEQQA
ncbi:MAG: hypothetical protein A2040_08135 [Rhodocyclales bacterium GWA2_65_19]|nr:MAG: hypothetical protein A2040_08135 [Rhodocyclales bacterium GWA2_65_19]